MGDSSNSLVPDPVVLATKEPGSVRRAVLAAVVAALLGGIAVGGWYVFRSVLANPSWRAQVVDVSADDVCIVSFEGEPDGGFVQPTCHGPSEVEFDGDLAVGDCVEARVHHPAVVIERIVECPIGLPLSPQRPA